MKRVFQWGKKIPPQRKDPPVPVVEHLKRVDVFKDLTQDEVEALFHSMVVRECKPGTVFFMPEDSTERLFILKTGRVDLYRLTPNGKRLVTRCIEPGTVFGEMGLLGQSMQNCFAEATENSLVCIATKDDVLQLLKERPAVALRLMETLGNRLRLLEQRLEQTAFSPVKVRLASFIIANTDPVTGAVAGYTHEEIGDIIGTLRQTVTETLSELQSQRLIEVKHKRIQVADRRGLEQVVSDHGVSD
ncbi:MAG: Crp/Fnr family transcriptional regulator [Chloroflexi bacterium]|nr:Crp/Fnr family transcriptional regulator [Chloroflexota bacterium]